MKSSACYIAATGQNVGKTTTCLGIISGLKKKFPSVGFMKPVGQEHVDLGNNVKVDKDVLLFKEHFHLPTPTQLMSPVLFPKGFTKDYLDRKISDNLLIDSILNSFKTICQDFPFVVVEGTGHMGVGAIANLHNAQVAKKLNLSVFIVAPAGLGSSFDSIY